MGVNEDGMRLRRAVLSWFVLLMVAFAGAALAQQESEGAESQDEPGAQNDANGPEAAQPDPTEPGQVWHLSMFDEDGDEGFSLNEFGTAIYGLLVGDADGMDEAHFERAVAVLGLDPEEFSFEAVDVNNDGVVTDDQEFIPGVINHVFSDWSGGAERLSLEDVRTNLFEAADENSDGVLDEQEFALYAEVLDVSYEEYAGGSEGVTPDKFLSPRQRPDQDQ